MDEIINCVVTVGACIPCRVVIIGFIAIKAMSKIQTIYTTHDFTLLTLALFHEFIDSVVTILAGIILQIEVVVFIALDTVCVVMTIKAVGNVARDTVLP